MLRRLPNYLENLIDVIVWYVFVEQVGHRVYEVDGRLLTL
ncbi:hypothetical protein PXNS11_380014 [Stutzerimonas xanthomarina]|nr:hypothetical protein PXNS11_380014 [Stutzerimonas xanthomarina]